MSWWQRLFGREKKPKAQASPTTASSVTTTVRPSGTQKDAAVEMQLKIVYARVEELASRIPRNTDWNEALGNFAKNLYAARRALTDGRDMRGNPISRSDIAAGLRRMCDSYSGPTSLSILGGIHGSGIRKEFEEILERTLAIANTLAGDLIDERHLDNLVDRIAADVGESAKQFVGELKEIESMTLDQLKATP